MFNHPINPATGLPMTDDDIGGVDVGGNPYGTGGYQHPWSSAGGGFPETPCWGDF